jgi:Fe-coproporphyrin III synthase
MNLLGPDARTLEVHPIPFTRLLHRYPSSGHREWDRLGTPLLLAAVGEASQLGYTSLHVSGDEPLHCPALHSLCDEAHRHGMKTTLQLRQGELSQRLLKELQGSVDLLGVVLESRPAAHGRVRKCRELAAARELGMEVGVIIKLTRGNMNDLEWAAQFAAEHGARALSIRPCRVSDEQLATAWMVVEFLRDVCRGVLRIGFEVPNRYCLPVELGELNDWQRGLPSQPQTLGDLLSPLVIDSSGMVLPLRAGFPRALALGALGRCDLRELAEDWISCRSADFTDCYRSALARSRSDNQFNDFFDLLAEEAGRSRAAALAVAG